MVDFKVPVCPYHRYDVEAYESIDVEVFDIGIRSYYDVSYLLPIHRFVRFDVIRVSAGFYFHDNQFITFSGNNVQLEVVLSPVSVTNGISVVNEVTNSRLFSGLSQ